MGTKCPIRLTAFAGSITSCSLQNGFQFLMPFALVGQGRMRAEVRPPRVISELPALPNRPILQGNVNGLGVERC